jgi:uncharacterized membrane protein HdeD (DUF308 family)
LPLKRISVGGRWGIVPGFLNERQRKIVNKPVEQSSPAARNVRLLWAIVAAVFGLIFLVELFFWLKGQTNIGRVLLPAGLALLNVAQVAEQRALRRLTLIAGFVLGALGALLMILHWAD